MLDSPADLNYTSFNFTFQEDNNAIEQNDAVKQCVLKILFYSLSMLVAVCGNLAIIVVISVTKSLRTNFNVYIVNLAVADFLVPVFCMWVHLVNSMSDKWPLGPFFCKIHTYMEVLVVTVSIFTLLIVSLDRFLAAIFPSCLFLTQKCQWLTVAITWLLGACISLPWALYMQYFEYDWFGGHEIQCSSTFPSEQIRKNYTLAFFFCMYVFPVCAIMVLLVIAVVKTGPANRPTSDGLDVHDIMRKRALYLLLTILVVFLICWTPQQTLLVWDVFRDRENRPNGVEDLKYLALYLAYTTSAINPVIYVIYNKCFRHATWQILRNCTGCTTLSTVEPDLPVVRYNRNTGVSIDEETVTTINET